MPTAPNNASFPHGLAVSCFGQTIGNRGGNAWSRPSDSALTEWSNLGFVAGLDPFVEPSDVPVKIFVFTLHRLPRDSGRWKQEESISRCEIRIGTKDELGNWLFSKMGPSNA